MSKSRAGIHCAVYLAGSQKALANELGVSNTSVNKWVRQGYVPLERVKQIHKLFPEIPKSSLCDPAFLMVICEDNED